MEKLRLRFRRDDATNFSDWTEVCLEDVGEIRTGTTPNIKDLKNIGGSYLWVTPTDITGKEVTVTATTLSKEGMDVAREIPANSVLVTCIASIGKNCVLRNKGSCNQQINSITPKFGYDVDFLYYLICRKESVLHSFAGHGGMEILNKSEFSKLIFKFPSFEEQQKIAAFFTALDEKIQFTQKKLDCLEKIKKGLIVWFMTQRISFKDKKYPIWKSGTIGDILDIKYGKDYKHLEPGTIPVLGTGGQVSSVDKSLCDWPCVLIGRKGTIDKPQYMNSPFWCVDTIFYSKPKEGQNPLFQYYLFQTINWKKYNEASGVPSLSASTIENVKVMIPSLDEQQRIALFLETFDKKITNESKKMLQLKRLKQAFMQQMFI